MLINETKKLWNKNEFITLSRDEFCDIDSGIVCIVVGIAVAIAAILGLGTYNGYSNIKGKKII